MAKRAEVIPFLYWPTMEKGSKREKVLNKFPCSYEQLEKFHDLIYYNKTNKM